MVKRAFLAILAFVLGASLGQAETFSLPSGTTFHCRLTQTLGTRVSFQGDAFTATVTEPVMVNGQSAIPVGSTIDGHIALLVRPGRVKGVGEMRLAAEKLTLPDGRSFPLQSTLLSAYGAEGAKVGEEGEISGPNSRLKDLEVIGVGMGAGGFLGTIIGGFHGAVIGGALGGAVGLADRLRKRGPDLTLPAGTELNYQLTHPLVIQGGAPRVTASRETFKLVH